PRAALRAAEPPGPQLHPPRLAGRRRHREPEERRPGQDPRPRAAPDGDRGARGADGGARMTAERVHEWIQTRREGDLLWVTLNDPDRANALSPAMTDEITAIYRRPWREEGVRAILLSGAGKNFSAGADLEHLSSLRDAGPEENLRDSLRLKDLFESILRQEALTIALVHGACVAGGCGLATAHDFVIAAEGARFLYSEVRIGFVAALVATYLPLRLRGSDIRELLLNPQFVEAPKALEIGLANRLVPAADLATAGEALAVQIL